MYCPWDVMNYVKDLLLDSSQKPKNYWENTSDNAIVRTFLDNTEVDVQDAFETLLAGGSIREPITENLTYDTIHSSEENLWSLLYFTGYLTRIKETDSKEDAYDDRIPLAIPNKEILGIFRSSVKSWFRDRARGSDRKVLFDALWNGDAETLTTLLSDLLFDTISYHDYRESFYHAFLAGLLANAGYPVESNYEYGTGTV